MIVPEGKAQQPVKEIETPKPQSDNIAREPVKKMNEDLDNDGKDEYNYEDDEEMEAIVDEHTLTPAKVDQNLIEFLG